MKSWNLVILPLLTFLVSFGLTQGQKCNDKGVCDKLEACTQWKENGTCERNKQYMKQQCPVSCGGDDDENQASCKDIHPRCPAWAKLVDECQDNPEMRKYCAKSCNLCSSSHQNNSASASDASENETSENQEDEFEEDGGLCVDHHESCKYWADQGECTANPNYMLKNCPRSCTSCAKTLKRNKARRGATTEEAATTPKEDSSTLVPEVLFEESANFGEKQVADGSERINTLKVISETIDYMKSDTIKTLPSQFRDECKNRHELCSFWAVIGECDANMAYMKIQCAPSCKSCHLIDISQRCPLNDDQVPALTPGSLNKMMERIVANAPGNKTETDESRQLLLQDSDMTDYSVAVLSRPSENPVGVASKANDKLPPWVLVFENFVTDEEADAMVQLGYMHEYKRSADVGKIKFDGTHDSVENNRRTSENAWCSDHNGCRKEEVPQRLHRRMSKVMDIPTENSEDLQILKYEVGQFYRTHHDYIAHQVERQCGPRILTFFLYLSDVEEGGGTDFPDLGITVNPKKGRALLWPSVYDSDPMSDDPRMRHQALPVKAGTKFAANGWIHMYDYADPQRRGCN